MNKIILTLIVIAFTSCKDETKYPIYSIEKVSVVPDSLKTKHREWITETIRAANQHLSAGDYESIDETIIQAERTADNLFSIEALGLRKKVDNSYYNDIIIAPIEIGNKEKQILDSLLNNR